MDLSVHKTMLYFALQRAGARNNQKLQGAFHTLWLGNWITDMNQATAFFDAAQGRVNPYDRWRADGTYKLPDAVSGNAGTWTSLFQSLWKQEWLSVKAQPASAGMPDSNFELASADDIGGYDPRDHGDVVDRLDPNGNPIPDEMQEFAPTSKTGMTLTAKDMIFSHCLERWLRPAFSTPSANRITDPIGLRHLGQATHILQDFFAHSNYVEVVLQISAQHGNLPSDLAELIRAERPGTFASYLGETNAETSVVMTGRFDRIDLIASLLRIYREGLLPMDRDLGAGGLVAGTPSSHRDLLFEVLFGTFSNNPFVSEALQVVRTLDKFHNAVAALGKEVTNGIIRTFGWVGRLFTNDTTAQTSIKELEDLAVVANSTQASDWARVGRLMYLEYVIEQKIRAEMKAAGGPKLPHHALLNKDSDVGQPETRLVHKLASCFATDVTTEILGLYFAGGSAGDAEPILKRYYRHPRSFVDDSSFRDSLRAAVDRMYGIRWWQRADDDSGRIVIA